MSLSCQSSQAMSTTAENNEQQNSLQRGSELLSVVVIMHLLSTCVPHKDRSEISSCVSAANKNVTLQGRKFHVRGLSVTRLSLLPVLSFVQKYE